MAYKRIQMVSAEQILKADYGKQEWLVEGLLPLQTITIISGAPENYKSWLTLHLAICVAEGKDFLGKFKISTKRKVLIFDKENPERYIQTRLNTLGALSTTQLFYNCENESLLDDESFVAELLMRIEGGEIDLIIFDSLVRYHTKDENSATQMATVFNAIKKITDAGANVIFTHHHRKDTYGRSSANSLRGSSDIFAAVDTLFSLEFDDKHDVVVFTHHKARHTKKQGSFAAKIIRDENNVPTNFEFVGSYDDKKEKRTKAKQAITELFKKSGTLSLMRPDVHTALKNEHATSILDSALQELVDEKKLQRRIGSNNKHIYDLPIDASPSANSPTVENLVGQTPNNT